MEISMNELTHLFSIGEVCKTLGITRRIVLNYEECGLIKPDIKNGPNGNRFYTLDTMTQIRIIRLFQNYGLSLNEIKEYFTGTVDMLSLIRRLEALRDKLDSSIKSLYERVNLSPHEVTEIFLPAQTVYARKLSSDSISEKTAFLRDTALKALSEYGTDMSKQQYCTEYSLDNPLEVTFCAAVKDSCNGEHIINLPSCHGLCFHYHGPYETIRSANEILLKYAGEHDILHSGRFRNIYLEGPPQHKDKNKFITNVVLFI